MADYNDNIENSGDQGERAIGDVTTNPDAESGLEGRPEDSVGQFAAGTPVYLPNEYFTLEKGVFFTRDFYVPLSAVESITPDAVHLNVDKDQMAYLGWDAQPSDVSFDNASSLSVEEEDGQS
jgi:hypothetical protein